ncbi:Uncharacterized protein FKW44_006978 [Caligus rogercresseyi]|uniref:Uncharacterized protein n=1 Tax=Caligus rogercresseyi TaxID=217165 RepID=A0A7T8QT77_CALRO|nr:Uncharacterized protein FKW44_006978 [Caligus rogercresseyi]
MKEHMLLEQHIPTGEVLPDPGDELGPQDLDVVGRSKPVAGQEPDEIHGLPVRGLKAQGHNAVWMLGGGEGLQVLVDVPEAQVTVIAPVRTGSTVRIFQKCLDPNSDITFKRHFLWSRLTDFYLLFWFER